MRITSKAQIAIAVVNYFGKHPNQVFTSKYIAEEISASELFLSNILLQMRKSKIVVANKGPGGGYRLMVPYTQITVMDILDSLNEKVENKWMKSEFFSQNTAKNLDEVLQSSLRVKVAELG